MSRPKAYRHSSSATRQTEDRDTFPSRHVQNKDRHSSSVQRPDRKYRHSPHTVSRPKIQRYSYFLPHPYRFCGQATACAIETFPESKEATLPFSIHLQGVVLHKQRGNFIIPPHTYPIRKCIWTKCSQCLVVSMKKISPLQITN